MREKTEAEKLEDIAKNNVKIYGFDKSEFLLEQDSSTNVYEVLGKTFDKGVEEGFISGYMVANGYLFDEFNGQWVKG